MEKGKVMRLFRSLLGTWVAGLLAMLPLALTLLLLAWAVKLVHVYLGPGSPLGHFFALLGKPFVAHPALEYLVGFALLLMVVFPLGLLVQSRLQQPLARFAEASIRRIPLVGSPYLAVLVPTAPVPIGGGLLYVPVDRVRPARMGVERVTSIYLSMGLVQPQPRTEV